VLPITDFLFYKICWYDSTLSHS